MIFRKRNILNLKVGTLLKSKNSSDFFLYYKIGYYSFGWDGPRNIEVGNSTKNYVIFPLQNMLPGTGGFYIEIEKTKILDEFYIVNMTLLRLKNKVLRFYRRFNKMI